MPDPQPDETRDEFIERCIPEVISEGTADDGEQAAAVCNSMWEQAKEGAHIDMTKQQHYLEANIEPGKTGREWEVTIVGAQSPDDVVTVNGREYVRSKHGRLYAVDALKNSVQLWDGTKVYDDHLTDDEFEARHGWRSPKDEWLGSLVKPRFVREGGLPQLRAVFKVVEDAVAKKLKNAYELDVLNTIGLSMDTFTEPGNDEFVDGHRMETVEGFTKILSVDLVGNPAAGGGFNRLLAAIDLNEESDMDNEELKALLEEELGKIPTLVEQQVNTALEAREAEEVDEEIDVDDLSDEEVAEALSDRKRAKVEESLSKAEKDLIRLRQQAQQEQRKTELARTELTVERELEKARLPEKFEEAVRAQFENRVVEKEEIQQAIKRLKEAQASLDPSGRVRAGGDHDIQVGIVDEDRFELEFQRLMMGNTEFRDLEHNEDKAVKERLQEAGAYKSWINNGKPELPRYNRISSLLYDFFGGDPLLNPRASEAATTSSLATVVKNTVNIMTANDYSQREEWWGPITRTEEVDTIDDATLARVYGVDTLDVVSEGAAYTELAVSDDEETASFVKRGNYIGITLETLMKDKIQYVRRIPGVLADAWFNTQSDLVANVFTVNSAAGPVLSDTGALFNATALATTGGHANLLTDALSHSAYSTARTAMRKQTDQSEGAGRKLLIRPRYMLVPVDLETTALEIRNSELVPEADGAGTDGNQTANLFRGEFDVIPVPSWTDATDWALVADPAQFPAIWLVYPRGQRTPQIFSADNESAGSMFTNDEMRFKVRLMTYRFSATYDCAPVSDFRALHKNNVAG